MKLLLPDGAAPAADPIGEIFKSTKTIAVVGLSSNPTRPSYGVGQYLKAAGYRIIPVNPNEREVLGERAYARLEDVPVKIDMVDIFRRVDRVAPVVDSAIAVGTKVLWMQLDIIDATAGEKARKTGMIVVMDACTAVEHRKRRTQRA